MSDIKLGRNEEILRLRRDGMSYKHLAQEFGLSDSRVRQICEKTRALQKFGRRDIPEIYQACQEFNVPSRLYTQIVHALYNAGLIHNNKWKRISRAEFLKLNNIGNKLADILERAQEIANQ
jgi:transcriptional regulator with XRE-family HTH domain